MLEEILLRAAMSAGQKFAANVAAKAAVGFGSAVATNMIGGKIGKKESDKYVSKEFETPDQANKELDKMNQTIALKRGAVAAVAGVGSMVVLKGISSAIENSN